MLKEPNGAEEKCVVDLSNLKDQMHLKNKYGSLAVLCKRKEPGLAIDDYKSIFTVPLHHLVPLQLISHIHIHIH